MDELPDQQNGEKRTITLKLVRWVSRIEFLIYFYFSIKIMNKQVQYWTNDSKRIALSCWIPSESPSNQTSFHKNLDIIQWNSNDNMNVSPTIKLKTNLPVANTISKKRRRKNRPEGTIVASRKIRIYPDKFQMKKCKIYEAACRFIKNQIIDEINRRYINKKKRIS